MLMEPYLSERLVGRGVLVALPQRIEKYSLGPRLLLVADETTYVAAGAKVEALLTADYKVTTHRFAPNVKPEIAHVEWLSDRIRTDSITGVVSVGSGTINDLSKLAAARAGIPYLSVATAASMNGYSSAGASVLQHGHKISERAAPPRAVIADVDILAAAPRRLARSGLGDTLCRSTVEADCLLSHLLFGTAYPAEGFAQLRAHEAALIAGAFHLREDSADYLQLLMEALLDAGDWMTRSGSSAIASQGEHMLAHTLEMLYGREMTALHGEMIAVTTVSMHHLQHKMLLGELQLRHLPREESQFQRIFGKQMGGELFVSYGKKLLSAEQAETFNARLKTDWPEMRDRLKSVMVHGTAIERAFLQAGIGCSPKDIGISDERYQSALSYAYLTRDRFTFLDLATMMGRRV